jgi:arsenate reductase (thioredoxin)
MMAKQGPSVVPEVLFVCVHNAGRSQMAAALLERHAGDRVRVRSAGTAPSDSIDPNVVAAMDERGLDVSSARPKGLSDDDVHEADVVVTMGCGDACPVVPGTRYLDWDLPDPAGKTLAEIRPIRDDIERRVLDLLRELVPED